MKKKLVIILLSALATFFLIFVLYFGFAFCLASFNPFNWTQEARVGFALTCIPVCLFFPIIKISIE